MALSTDAEHGECHASMRLWTQTHEELRGGGDWPYIKLVRKKLVTGIFLKKVNIWAPNLWRSARKEEKHAPTHINPTQKQPLRG